MIILFPGLRFPRADAVVSPRLATPSRPLLHRGVLVQKFGRTAQHVIGSQTTVCTRIPSRLRRQPPRGATQGGYG